MELVYILNALWRKRWIVALGVLIGGLAAISMLFRVSLSPLGLHDRSFTVGGASTEILIDAPKSALGDQKPDITNLTSRTGIFARFLTSEGATAEIARDAGVPGDSITVTGQPLMVDGVPDAQTAERVSKLGTARKYLLRVQQGSDLPVIQIYTQAPTKEGARRIADSAAVALSRVVEDIQRTSDVPEKRRLVIRQLGNTRAGEVSEKPSLPFAAALFFGIVGAFCLAILGGPSVVAAWRAEERAQRLLPVVSNGNGNHPHSQTGDQTAQSVEAILLAAFTAADAIREDARRQAEAHDSAPGNGERPIPPSERQLGP
jgi:hypothetical protein